MHPNHQVLTNFLSGFTLLGQIKPIDRIDGQLIPNGYTATYWNDEHRIGFTVVTWGDSEFKVVVEKRPRPVREAA